MTFANAQLTLHFDLDGKRRLAKRILQSQGVLTRVRDLGLIQVQCGEIVGGLRFDTNRVGKELVVELPRDLWLGVRGEGNI